MLSDVDKLYDEEYCEYIESKQWRFEQIPSIVEILYDHFRPTSVIDIGCANGLHLKAFRDLGVKKVFGIEGTRHWAPYIEKHFGVNYIIADLREPLPFPLNCPVNPIQFDLVICFEVLEHLRREYARRAIENLMSLGNTLCISASPYRRGFEHLNPQRRKYWVKAFRKLGAEYYEEDVKVLQSEYEKIDCKPNWFKSNLKVFRHEG